MSRTSCFSFCVHINRIDQPHFQPLLDVVGRHFIQTRKYMTLSIPIKVKSISYSKFPSKISTTECLMFSHTIDLCFMIPAMFYCMDSWSNTYFLHGRRLWYLYTSFSKFKIPVGVFLRKKNVHEGNPCSNLAQQTSRIWTTFLGFDIVVFYVPPS